mmetsp:Transcript_26127/g.57860  ORF Transcript_26127/g.57860 Transcript_26127/m.57860 type:complete len:147 (+) Transcript_26127:135-575(+)
MQVITVSLLLLCLCLSHTAAQDKDPKDPKPKATLHIGPHKTGTTSVQHMLEVAMKHGGMNENTYWLAHGKVVQFSRNVSLSAETAKMARILAKSLKRGRNVLLSTENFAFMRPKSILRLKDMLQGFDVTVLAVYREYISHLISFHF